jgi:hypothetical protein
MRGVFSNYYFIIFIVYTGIKISIRYKLVMFEIWDKKRTKRVKMNTLRDTCRTYCKVCQEPYRLDLVFICETVYHYILECPRYVPQREILVQSLRRKSVAFSLDNLKNGNAALSIETNRLILKSFHDYLLSSRRFQLLNTDA